MKKIIAILIFAVLFTTLILLPYDLGLVQPSNETTADRIHRRGYNSETHQVITDDGYILPTFRIVNGTYSENSSRPVVLMMHGLSSSSDAWVIGGEGNILAFTLASQGYDVWLANVRGNSYSKHHISLCSDDRAFWRFSWHEIGVLDLPATIDYILNVTGQPSMHYVGHSQGTAILFVLLSTYPEYNKILKTSHLLGPIAFTANQRSTLLYYLAMLFGEYSSISSFFGDMPFLTQSLLLVIIGKERCRDPSANPRYCSNLLYTLTGGASDYLNQSLIPEIFETHPSGCSTQQVIHWTQLYVSRHFRQYDYGPNGNLKRYGSSIPPDYKIEHINPKYPLHLYYSDFDEMSSKTDVERFANILGKNAVRHFIDVKGFAHIDFLWSSNVHEVLHRGIIERMNEMELEADDKDINGNKSSDIDLKVI